MLVGGDHLSKYVVVGGIPQENWAASGWEGVRWDNPDVVWGHRGPLVVSRVWKKLVVKLEVLNTAAVGVAVKSGVLVEAKQFGAQLLWLLVVGVCRGVPLPLRGVPQLGSTRQVALCAMAVGRRDICGGTVVLVGCRVWVVIPRSVVGGVVGLGTGSRSTQGGPYRLRIWRVFRSLWWVLELQVGV